MLKINRFNKSSDRLLVISEKRLYKLDSKKCKLMKGENLSDVVGLTCSSGKDQLVVMHMKSKNDLIVSLSSPGSEDRVGELVAVLVSTKA